VEEGTRLSEGRDLFVQSYGLSLYPRVADECSALLTGVALDLTLGGSYLTNAILERSMDDEHGLDWALGKGESFPPEKFPGLLKYDALEGLKNELREEARLEWSSATSPGVADRCDRFFLRTRVWRQTFHREVWVREFLEDPLPTFDNRFVDLLLRIPARWRVGHLFYRRFLEFLAPEVMGISYQRTGLPPSVPVEFWDEAARLESKKEQLYRDIWRATNGKVFLPYKRFYSNFDEWLRLDPSWIALTDTLLADSNARIYEALVNKAAVDNMVERHRSGVVSHYPQLIQLMGLEAFLRTSLA
jgi:hypothetical protein